MSTKTRDISGYLDDIATAMNEAEEFTGNMTYETFASDRKTVNAVTRSLEKYSGKPQNGYPLHLGKYIQTFRGAKWLACGM
jgi:hypothetical protein